MSDLFRKSVKDMPQRPPPNHISHSSIPEGPSSDLADDHPPSDSSSSSADSAASAQTVRPSSREHSASNTHWSKYFSQELYLEHSTKDSTARYHVYLTPPQDPKKGPLFICHHGAGASGLSFALFAQHLKHKVPEAGLLSLEARGHGSVVTRRTSSSDNNEANGEAKPDYSLATLVSDALTMINLTREHLSWSNLPPTILIGHSLGGAVVTSLAASHASAFGTNLVGFAVLDVVEGSALEALGHMKSYLASRPSTFSSVEEAVDWHVRTRTVRNRESAEISTPPLLIPSPAGDGKSIWLTDLSLTPDFWWDWFTGMSSSFLKGRGAKLLILAGADRLDKELMIGQMQGKFQLTVIPEAGHFVQEDCPEKTADVVAEFWRRNDRGAMVLPPKVSDLIAQGKKV